MTVLAAPTGNEIQNVIAVANSFERGTDTTIVLTSAASFPDSAHVIRIRNADNTKWCLVIYTTKAGNTLTMGGGAADYALAKNVTIGDETYEWLAGSVVELVCAADEIAQLFTEQADKIDEDGSVPLTADWDIGNGRYIAADKIRARDGDGLLLEDDGGNGIEIVDGGFLNFAKQSNCRVYVSADQTTVTTEAGWLILDTEDTDIQNEFDSTLKTGAADFDEANKLHDADGGFEAADVNGYVYNTTNHLYAKITGFVDAGELDLDSDAFPAGNEPYKLFRARFTATKPGTYLVVLQVAWADPTAAKFYQQAIYKNNAIAAAAMCHSAVEDWLYVQNVASLELGANDYLTFQAYQSSGGNEGVRGGTQRTWVSVIKLA